MDDPINQQGGQSSDGGMGGVGNFSPPPPPAGPPPMREPMGGSGNDPHDKIIDALKRIEDKLAAIAAKVGA